MNTGLQVPLKRHYRDYIVQLHYSLIYNLQFLTSLNFYINRFLQVLLVEFEFFFICAIKANDLMLTKLYHRLTKILQRSLHSLHTYGTNNYITEINVTL